MYSNFSYCEGRASAVLPVQRHQLSTVSCSSIVATLSPACVYAFPNAASHAACSSAQHSPAQRESPRSPCSAPTPWRATARPPPSHA
eukprot:365530-Chlamydomonas_euryale.AAC.18